jgi:hypothetical protein
MALYVGPGHGGRHAHHEPLASYGRGMYPAGWSDYEGQQGLCLNPWTQLCQLIGGWDMLPAQGHSWVVGMRVWVWWCKCCRLC